MSDEQATPPQAPTLLAKLSSFVGDTFEEAKLSFYVTIFSSWISMALCHWLNEMTALGPILTGMWAGFTALIAKIGWSKNG